MSKKLWTILIGLLFIVLGVSFIFDANDTINTFIKYIGIALLVIGALQVIITFMGVKTSDHYANFTYSGILNIVLGVYLVLTGDLTIKIFAIVVGMWLILLAAGDLSVVINVKRITDKIDKQYLITFIVKLILGIAIVALPNIAIATVSVPFGVLLVVVGITTITSIKTLGDS